MISKAILCEMNTDMLQNGKKWEQKYALIDNIYACSLYKGLFISNK